MCQPNGEANAFLCPNGTMFNQQYFICDWWYNLDCDQQPRYILLLLLLFNQQYFICDWWYNLDCDQQPRYRLMLLVLTLLEMRNHSFIIILVTDGADNVLHELIKDNIMYNVCKRGFTI